MIPSARPHRGGPHSNFDTKSEKRQFCFSTLAITGTGRFGCPPKENRTSENMGLKDIARMHGTCRFGRPEHTPEISTNRHLCGAKRCQDTPKCNPETQVVDSSSLQWWFQTCISTRILLHKMSLLQGFRSRHPNQQVPLLLPHGGFRTWS